jgi:hypothetical protein
MLPHSVTSPTTKSEEIKVFIINRDSKCEHCGRDLPHPAWITLAGEAGARCQACADLDELVFLPSGDAAVTRRARAHSSLSAVVLKWSRARKRYERQGLLVQEPALAQAEGECLADADSRASDAPPSRKNWMKKPCASPCGPISGTMRPGTMDFSVAVTHGMSPAGR